MSVVLVLIIAFGQLVFFAVAIFSNWKAGRISKKLIESLMPNSAKKLEQIGWPLENHYENGGRLLGELKARMGIWGLPPLPWIPDHSIQLASEYRFWCMSGRFAWCLLVLSLVVLADSIWVSVVYIFLFVVFASVFFTTPSWSKYLRKAQ